MRSFDFETISYGKWILAGEHAVLRGHAAIVFPVTSKQFILRFKKQTQSTAIEVKGDQELSDLCEQVLHKGLSLVGRSSSTLTGFFRIENTIPIGVGLGASAALCVALARWFIYQGWVEASQLFPFAKELEHLFHGRSSGLDIVGVASECGHCFQQGLIQPIHPVWKPHWMLSYCGEKSKTSDCIQAVQLLWQTNQTRAEVIDQNMSQSVEIAKQALLLEQEQGRSLLVASMQQASRCFQDWGLVNQALHHHMSYLLTQGALAVKPTGSGGGGSVLSLWLAPPPLSRSEWILV